MTPISRPVNRSHPPKPLKPNPFPNSSHSYFPTTGVSFINPLKSAGLSRLSERASRDSGHFMRYDSLSGLTHESHFRTTYHPASVSPVVADRSPIAIECAYPTASHAARSNHLIILSYKIHKQYIFSNP